MSPPAPTDYLSRLAAELCQALSLYARALTQPCDRCITDVSECLRRAASLCADAHTELLTQFCPALPRTPCVVLCERLYACVLAVFRAAMLLPAERRPESCLATEAQGLCRLSTQLRQEIDALSASARGREHHLPDAYAYHAELTRVHAAVAMHAANGQVPHARRAICAASVHLADALSEAFLALLALVSEAV